MATKGRGRGPKGRILSATDSEAAAKEALQRLQDAAFLPPEVHARREAQHKRFLEFTQERKERRERFSDNKQAYQWKRKPDTIARDAYKLASRGYLPKPNQVIKHGEQFEYIWSFQGQYGLDAVSAILIKPAKLKLPKDTAGYVSHGTGYGKDARWVGTKFAYVWPRFTGDKTLWWETQTLHTSTTTSIKNLREDQQRGLTRWTELKLLSMEGLTYNDTDTPTHPEKPKRKANRAKPKHRSAKKQKLAKSRAKRGSTGKRNTKKNRSKQGRKKRS